jgi:DMSO/TMAO reductase YedYZ molybdopterin-dependent catalytic subunit
MSRPTRGFVGKRRAPRDRRLPPGQYDIGRDFPVLTAEVTPRVHTDRWTMTVDGLVRKPGKWTWDELHALPQEEYRGDIHCVTTWSKFDTRFGGVSIDLLLDREHGGPVRLLVPHLYFWKSAKWVTKLTLLDHDVQGFWERNGYHDLGDPWREQRYQGD